MILSEMYALHTYSRMSRINLLTINRLMNAATEESIRMEGWEDGQWPGIRRGKKPVAEPLILETWRMISGLVTA